MEVKIILIILTYFITFPLLIIKIKLYSFIRFRTRGVTFELQGSWGFFFLGNHNNIMQRQEKKERKLSSKWVWKRERIETWSTFTCNSGVENEKSIRIPSLIPSFFLSFNIYSLLLNTLIKSMASEIETKWSDKCKTSSREGKQFSTKTLEKQTRNQWSGVEFQFMLYSIRGIV